MERPLLNRQVNLHETVLKCSHRHYPILFIEKSLNLLRMMNMNGKKAVIVVSLVEESAERSNREIEKEITEELSKHLPTIPWLNKVEKVTITEA